MADVLVVEDHVDSAETIITALRHAGHDVRHALDGEAALAALVEKVPDAIVLDIRLPVLDGIGFMDVVRSYLRWKDIPVVVVSAASDAEVDRVEAKGVHRTFRKANFQLRDLVETIQEILPQPTA